MKFRLAVVTASILVGQFAFAGAENVSIDCASASGRTKVMADVPGDNLDAYVIVKIDDKSIGFANRTLKSIGINVNTLGAERVADLSKGAATASIAAAESKSAYALTVVDTATDVQ